MKIFWIVLGIVVIILAVNALVNYLLQRQRQNRAQREGVVVYSTVASIEKVGGWAKHLDMKKIVLRVQEPGTTVPREVTLRTRTAPNQKIVPGLRLPVAIDPKNPKRVYPASKEAIARIVVTGSREERRQMRAQISGVKARTQVVRRRPGRAPWD